MNFKFGKTLIAASAVFCIGLSAVSINAEEEVTAPEENTAETEESSEVRQVAYPWMLGNANGFTEENVLSVEADIDLEDLADYLNHKEGIEEFSGMCGVFWDGQSTQEEGVNYVLNIRPVFSSMYGNILPFGEYYEGKPVKITCTVGDVFEEGTPVSVTHTKEDGTVADYFETAVTDGVVVINNEHGFSTFTIVPLEQEVKPEVPADETPAVTPEEPAETETRKAVTNTGVR